MHGRNSNSGFSTALFESGRCLTAIATWLGMVLLISGCYAPIHSRGISARTLPNEFRWPQRTAAAHLNYSSLVGETPTVYTLGPGDRLEVTIPDLVAAGTVQTLLVTVLDDGTIQLPRTAPLMVEGLTVAEAQHRINSNLAGGLLINPSAIVSLAEKATVNVLVLGAVKQPGVHALPRFENDVAHALAAAQGFTEDAGDVIEVHRRQAVVPGNVPGTSGSNYPPVNQRTIQMMSYQPGGLAPGVYPHGLPGSAAPPNVSQAMRPGAPPASPTMMPPIAPQPDALQPFPANPGNIEPYAVHRYGGHSVFQPGNLAHLTPQEPLTVAYPETPIVRIPLRGLTTLANPTDVVLNAADVIIVPPRQDKVFYVVGPLSAQRGVRFSLGEKDREIGNGLLLPDDREIDVVTAVAMAGYIDPIESPTTVSVHRTGPNGMPLLIKVDLIAARTDPYETILVQPGDIIYLNPDPWWYYRRTLDRVIDRALGTAVGRWMTQ